jgi:hypothetical protein
MAEAGGANDESGDLLELCRKGRLYEIDALIAAGRTIELRGKLKKSPLDIAVEYGFHSLVALLARNVTDVSFKNRALQVAVEKKRLDLVEVLIEHGAEIRSIPLADVLTTWDPKLIRFFLDRGADPVTNSPFAVAFAERVRTALRPFVEYRKAHPPLEKHLAEQADRALTRRALGSKRQARHQLRTKEPL